ncbi:MAG: AMP-dependent synthetase and ligase [Deltaproteobacteria bacterium]|nr:AMP-dependent synthetase and ligase [Deltaproteobacteria bacterium]
MSKRLVLKELSRYDTGTYADVIYRNAILYADEEAIKCNQESATFRQVNERINSLTHALTSLGVKKGDVLGILSWNCIDYADVYGAAMKYGYISSPFNPRLQLDELDYLINYSETNTLFVGPQLIDLVNQLKPRIPKVKHFISFETAVPGMLSHRELLAKFPKEELDIHLEEDDPVFLFYTSGTTGVPRAALYTQRRSIDDTRRFAMALSLEQGDKHIQIMPLFHVGGTKNFWGYFFVGGSNVIMPQISFDPAASLQAVQDEKATDIHIVATHLAAFLAMPDVDKYDLSSLKRMFYAASPMPLELLKRGMEKWGPIFMEFYGGTEDGPNVTMLSVKQHRMGLEQPDKQHILTSAGFPHIGVHVRIVNDAEEDVEPGEVGEIIVYSKGVLKEWWHKPDDTAETIKNGWVHTGDMGRYDEQGYIYIVDRKRDMICSGGENVYPREIEEILYQHPAVHEAAVFGIPDDYWVEKVHAAIVLKPDASATEKDIIEFCKQRLARYKAPKSVEFMEALAKNPAGKILKKVMREKYWVGKTRRV